MDIFALLPLAAILCNIKNHKNNTEIKENYFSKTQCLSLKGFFSLIIIFHHLSQSITKGSVFPYYQYFGVLGTTGFFFISGYGLAKQLNTKKEDYIKGFLPKRLVTLLIPYFFMTVVYYIFRHKTDGYLFKQIFISMAKGNPVVSYSWYIITILCLYIIFFIAGKIYCTKHKTYVFIGTIILLLALYYAVCITLHFGGWWYNTVHTFLIGILWVTFEDKIFTLIQKKYALWTAIFVTTVVFALLIKINVQNNVILSHFTTLLMTSAFALLIPTICIKLDMSRCNVSAFIGKISLELYLIHGLAVKMYKYVGLDKENEILFSLSVISLSICSAVILNYCFNNINKVIFKSKIKKNS